MTDISRRSRPDLSESAGERPYLAGFESSTGARSLLERIPAITYVCNANYLAENFYTSPQSEVMTGYSSEAFLEDAACGTGWSTRTISEE